MIGFFRSLSQKRYKRSIEHYCSYCLLLTIILTIINSFETMGRGTQLTEYERGRIDEMRSQEMTYADIAARLNRSENVVGSYCRARETYGTKKSTGRPKKLDERARRLLLRTASNAITSSSALKDALNLAASARTIRRELEQCQHIQRMKMKARPPLTKAHKERRVQFSETFLRERRDPAKIIWSDEKRFNLDGPDGFQYYFHDLRKDEKTLSKRVQGGGGVMIWAAFGYQGKTEIAFIQGTMNSQGYQSVLEQFLLPVADEISGDGWVFQQDNAAVHTSRSTAQWFEDKHIQVLEWPARSPDLNPIENLWGILSRRVYANGKQYQSVAELKQAIVNEWAGITVEEGQNLIDSVPNRLLEVVKKNGNITHY